MKLFFILLSIIFMSCSSNSIVDNQTKINDLMRLAEHADSINDLESSIKHYSEILSLDSTKLTAINNRARAYVWTGEFDKGFQDFDRAIKYFPHEKTFFDRGMALCYVKRYDEAFQDFQAALKLNAKFGEAYYGLCLVKVNQNAIQEAIAFCDKADSLEYKAGLSHQLRAEICQKTGDHLCEIKELTESINLDGLNNPANYNNRGMAYNTAGKYAEAIKDFNMAIRIDPKIAYPYNNKAFSLFKLNQTDSALILVEQSLKIKSDNSYALKNRGEILLSMKKAEQACKDFNMAKSMSQDAKQVAELETLIRSNCNAFSNQ